MKNDHKSTSKAFERPPNPKSAKSSQSSIPKKMNFSPILKDENLFPFLIDFQNLPDLPVDASFVEYLRWMRELKTEDSEQNKAENNATKLHLLQLAQDEKYVNYCKYLKRANQRIKNIVSLKEGKKIIVTCPWRIRVGGHRGPESILLPAFDALGIPFIPSSTLRGIARNQAIREVMKNNPDLSYQKAEQHETIIDHFGSLETKDKSKREGKVTFLDAYPVDDKSPSGGLSLDIANNVWKWGENNLPEYQPNPNLFLSLKQPTFLIGIIPNHYCEKKQLNKVEQWLLKGLASGVGSQINSGYGCLTKSGKYENDENKQNILVEVEFTLKGQLINSYKYYNNLSRPYKSEKNCIKRDKKKRPQTLDTSQPEVRPIAFKSMLRYWFRVIALGVLPKIRVKELEAFIFGGIEPKHRGLIQVQIHNSDDGNLLTQKNFGTQSGKLIILASYELSQDNYQLLTDFIEALTWLMFHLGGVGLGARRPLYERKRYNDQGNRVPPYWRGTDLKAENQDEFWKIPETIEEFKKRFHARLNDFYNNLSKIQNSYIQFMQKLQPSVNHENYKINSQCPLKVEKIKPRSWDEALDQNCRVIVCQGISNNSKNFALSLLHSENLNKKYLNSSGKNKYLCGDDGCPSPVLVTHLKNYEVVVIFGASKILEKPKNEGEKAKQINPRYQYFTEIKRQCEQVKILWDGLEFPS
ncbi:type III-B CRISPR module RAMP protein Cmr6 [Gloeothece verrucosa]|uniref:CRISPR type III-associated protein domain-containing protein n=1 Tax=Gloeothece verrucosa (strain PCC 7822) TaxID=497965 RepID=E0UMM6_GLOV7|nr:type III-B CRISPR module RAMP protein Cmr6 [Gloeothece verrucosa]ADN18206.1 protein of unknown function DUF324 [Gloeothece verrucosa PCC 7822]